MGIGFSIYRVSEARFRESFFEQKLDLVRGLARLIDGETHARFTHRESVNDPEYQRYLHTMNRILQEQSFIRYLYSLNYDAQSGGFLYAVDAGIAANDTVRVECDQFALVISLDPAGELQLEYDERMYSSDFDLQVGNVSGGEALLRWNHPEWGRLSPLRFIGLAEETGLIVPLGHWVVQEACRCLEEITAAGLASPFISVNLSVRQLREPLFVQALEELLRGRNFALERLHFEITESLLLESSETMATIRALKDLGVRLVIDDFGIGYSSLSRLKDMPIHGLKLNRSFIAKLAVQKRDREIVRAVIAIAHELKLFVVAEGVERPDQVEFLHLIKCDGLQGYIYDPPLPAAEFLRLVREYSGPKCLPLKDVPGSGAKHPA